MSDDISLNTIDFSDDNSVEILNLGVPSLDILVNDTTARILPMDEDVIPIYVGALEKYLDQTSHLSAYGGFLTYTIIFESPLTGNAVIEPDVVLSGRNLTFIHQSYEQPANGRPFRGRVEMVENSFTTPSGGSVSRESFMMLLRDLDMIYIRATYWKPIDVIHISDISLIIADEDEEHYNLYEELAVEKCNCPNGYQGNSCENCAPGYYRDKNGPYGGYCVPCQCNGHAATCDCDTGICNVS